LQWWELAAAAGSSLAIHALIAAASHPGLRGADADAIEAAYVPWIGGLHTLLDSLVDMQEDASGGHHSFVAHYGSAAETAARMGVLAERSVELATRLDDGDRHLLIVAAMSSYYLSAPEARLPYACEATGTILAVLGTPGRLAMKVFRLRRGLAHRWPAAALRERHGLHSRSVGHTKTSRFRSR
jgi:tetraprenyl-beta-curcumene synthase